jgi:hypothetical protein
MAARHGSIREGHEEYAFRGLKLDFTPGANVRFRASLKPVFEDLRVARTTLSPGEEAF